MGGRVAHGLLRMGWRVRGWEGGTRVTKGGRAGPRVGGWHTVTKGGMAGPRV